MTLSTGGSLPPKWGGVAPLPGQGSNRVAVGLKCGSCITSREASTATAGGSMVRLEKLWIASVAGCLLLHGCSCTESQSGGAAEADDGLDSGGQPHSNDEAFAADEPPNVGASEGLPIV